MEEYWGDEGEIVITLTPGHVDAANAAYAAAQGWMALFGTGFAAALGAAASGGAAAGASAAGAFYIYGFFRIQSDELASRPALLF